MTPAQWTYQSSSKEISKGSCPMCTSSDAYSTYADGHRHCYSCNFHVPPTPSIDTVKASFAEGKALGSLVQLPSDFDHYIPGNFQDYGSPLGWLNKYGLTVTEKARHHLGYSVKRESIIFPVFGNSSADLLMYQSRYFGADTKVPKWKTVGYKSDVIHLPDPWEHDTIVLVEDLISAIKVSRVTNSMPIFGSGVSLPLLLRISKLFRRAKIWLDPDAKMKSLKIALELAELGMRTTNIFTEKDPKDYRTADIREAVQPLEEYRETK